MYVKVERPVQKYTTRLVQYLCHPYITLTVIGLYNTKGNALLHIACFPARIATQYKRGPGMLSVIVLRYICRVLIGPFLEPSFDQSSHVWIVSHSSLAWPRCEGLTVWCRLHALCLSLVVTCALWTLYCRILPSVCLISLTTPVCMNLSRTWTVIAVLTQRLGSVRRLDWRYPSVAVSSLLTVSVVRVSVP